VKTSGVGRFSLGQPVPARTHAVCVSLPTLEDVIGYEEKNPQTLAAMPTGYPRFVRHRMIQQMVDHLLGDRAVDHCGYLFARKQDCEDVMIRYRLVNPNLTQGDHWTLLALPKHAKENARVASHFQHTGCGISSRQAEDYLWKHGLIEGHEVLAETDQAEYLIKETISQAHGPEVEPSNLLLASSGANAFHALFRSATEWARQKNKSVWIRWGWLYLDTIEVMNLYGGEYGSVLEVNQVGQTEQLVSLFEQYGDQIAGIVTEFPTNPLLQSGDLQTARSLCDQAGALLIIDPTMASPKNAKITSLADVVVNSLTKYAGWEGDVMMGSLAFPQSSALGQSLFEPTRARICAPYQRDLMRLAEQIPFYNDFIERANQQALEVAAFLQGHPGIQKVHWAYQDGYGENYQKVAGSGCPGCNLSFELNGDFKTFYNRLQMLKSPSFGTEFSNCCPYVYLAHYPMMQTEDGRNKLQGAGIPQNLLRLSVGLEPVEEIIGALRFALQ
jgi:cystathionine gamma-synthase